MFPHRPCISVYRIKGLSKPKITSFLTIWNIYAIERAIVILVTNILSSSCFYMISRLWNSQKMTRLYFSARTLALTTILVGRAIILFLPSYITTLRIYVFLKGFLHNDFKLFLVFVDYVLYNLAYFNQRKRHQRLIWMSARCYSALIISESSLSDLTPSRDLQHLTCSVEVSASL